MKIIIAGAGNVGTHLAKLLSREKQDIILMDDDEEKLTALSSNFDLLTVTASPSSISGLKEVGVKEAASPARTRSRKCWTMPTPRCVNKSSIWFPLT